MRKRVLSLLLVITFLMSTLVSFPVFAEEGGDQMLDGISETDLILRYVFDGNVNDWTRNNKHATLYGNNSEFVSGTQFGTVLSLPGSSGHYVRIPDDALNGLDTVSVTGWIYLRSSSNYQRFFDFGQNTTRNFWCSPRAASGNNGYRARITVGGSGAESGPMTNAIPRNQWVHLAIVLDTTNETLSIYQDGVRVGQSTGVKLGLDDVLDQEDASNNRLYIGRSFYNDPYLGADLYDFRVYKIALTDEQVATIRNNALTHEVRVNADINSINLGNLNNRVTDIELPTVGPAGSIITWESSHPEFVSTTGKVTRPPYTYEQETVTVTLTATATLNEASATREFTVTVPRMPSDAEVVANDKAALNLGNLSAVVSDITLPVKGQLGSDITWTSSNEAVISKPVRLPVRLLVQVMQKLS